MLHQSIPGVNLGYSSEREFSKLRELGESRTLKRNSNEFAVCKEMKKVREIYLERSEIRIVSQHHVLIL